MKRNKRSITIHDVAQTAGVSVSTVSRVLNDKGDVALETIAKVRHVIDELGFTSSLAARGMRSRRTNVIGLVLPDVSSPYSSEVMRGVNKAIVNHVYDLMIYTNGDVRKYGTADQERHYVTLLNGSITDGVIVVTPVATHFSTDAPVVAIDPNTDSPDYPGIIAANREGAMAAMDYLTGLGHRRIGFITGRLDLASACQRLQGYKDGLEAVGIPYDDSLVQVGDFTTEVAVECARSLLRLERRPSAIFASNDMSAMGAYQAASEAGLRIPGDLSVIGFDNLPESAGLKPALTTIDQFVAEMGAMAVELVVKLIQGEVLVEQVQKIPTRLVLRDSCAGHFPPPGDSDRQAAHRACRFSRQLQPVGWLEMARPRHAEPG
jgi:LacI family transcriptional regulator